MLLQFVFLRCDVISSLEFSTLGMLTGNLIFEFYVFYVFCKDYEGAPRSCHPPQQAKAPAKSSRHRKQSGMGRAAWRSTAGPGHCARSDTVTER